MSLSFAGPVRYLIAYPDSLILDSSVAAARLRAYKLNKTKTLKIYEIKEVETVPPWPRLTKPEKSA